MVKSSFCKVSALLLAVAIPFCFACSPSSKLEPEDSGNNNGSNNQNGNNNGGDDNGKTDAFSDVQGNVDIVWIYGEKENSLSCEKDTAKVSFAAHIGDNYDVEWKVETSESWCTVKPASGVGSGEIAVALAANDTPSPRSAKIAIKSGTSVTTFSVSQSLSGGAMPDESWFKTNYWERTDREKAGLRGPVKSWYEDHYTTFHKYYYDEKGHLVKDEYHNLDKNSVEVDWEYEYDSEGHLVKQTSGVRGVGFSFEYKNNGKFVAADSFNWIPVYISGKSFPLSIVKDLSAIHYLDDTVGYYEKKDMYYVFGEDGNLTITEYFQLGRDEENPQKETHEYQVTYEDGYPVHFQTDYYSTTSTYASNGMPLTLVNKGSGGNISYSFYPNDKKLLTKRMDEPEATGFMPLIWDEYQYNTNSDITRRDHAFFSADQLYLDTYDKYVYDAHGNWIRRVETIEPGMQHGQRFPSNVGRVIEYYE